MQAIKGGGNALIGSSVPGSAATSPAGVGKPLDSAQAGILDAAGDRMAMPVVPERPEGQAGSGGLPDVPAVSRVGGGSSGSAPGLGKDDGLNLSPASSAGSTSSGISAPWKPASSMGAGGGALPPRGGSGSIATGVALATAQSSATTHTAAPNTTSSGSSAASSALLSTLGLNGSATAPVSSQPGTTISRNALATALNSKSGPGPIQPAGSPGPLTPSPAFTLLTLDYNHGTVLVPGFDQLATPGGDVDLRAQVVDSASGTYTYSWNTSGLTDATGISGSSTYDLTFHWATSISTSQAESATLTVTDPSSNQVSQTLTFWVPAGSGSTTGGTTWASTLARSLGVMPGGSPLVGLVQPAPERLVSPPPAPGDIDHPAQLQSQRPARARLSYNSLAANALPIVGRRAPAQLQPEHALEGLGPTDLQRNGRIDVL